MSLKGILTVATVTLAIIFMTCTSQIFVIWPFISPFNFHSIAILVSFNFFIFMTLLNYFLTCFTNPGTVPKRWMPRQQAYIEVKKSTHTPRYCKTCNGYKPPRTHHCSSCNRCVLKMDHHCPYINNCVGFSNYCHFIRFLVYVNISTIYLLVLLCCRLAQVVRDMRHYNIHPSPLEACFLSINLIMSTVVLITVGILTCYHTYCITTNTTTIEGWEKGRSLTIKGMGKIQNVKCPYDQGIFKNIQLVLGKWPIFWLIPQRITGNGLDFPINTKYVMEQQDEEEEMTLQKSSSMTSLTRPISYASSVVSPPEPIKSKNTGRSNNHLPQTPSSVMTFTSTVTTLVDYTSNNYHSKLPKSELEEDYR